MQIIDKLLGIFKLKSQVKALQGQQTYSQVSHITTQIYPTWQVFKDIETYRIMDDVSSVVNRLADTAAMIPLYAYKKTGEEIESGKLYDFLETLTTLQKLELFTFFFISNEYFGFKERVEFGFNKGVTKIHALHPNNMTIVLTTGFPTKVAGYIYNDYSAGIELRLLPEEVIHIRGFNPTTDFYSKWRGLSKITLLAQSLTRLQSGIDTSVAQMQNGGVPGIIFESDTDPFDVKDINKKRKENFARYVQNSANKGAPYFMGGTGKLQYMPLGLNLVDLDVSELAKIDFNKILNAYGLSNRLFNENATGSEVSDDNARKALYLTGLKPSLCLVEDALTLGLAADFKEDAVICFDLSDIPELQEDMVQKMNAMATAPVMVPNEVRLAQGLDAIKDPLMDKPYIKSGYMPLEDFNQVDPVEPPMI